MNNPCAEFMDNNFDEVFARYNELLKSKDFVIKQQSLKLLGEVLFQKGKTTSHFNVMIKYINSTENLKIMMTLLVSKIAVVQLEAFNVFKVFVANPKKPQAITDILVLNKTKLIPFLKKFQKEKEKEDEHFLEEKNLLLEVLNRLPDINQKKPEEEKPDSAPTAATKSEAPKEGEEKGKESPAEP